MMEPGKCVQLANLFISGSAIGNVQLSSNLQCFTHKSDLSVYIKGRLEEKGAKHIFLERVDSLSVDSTVYHQGWFYSISTVRPSKCVLGYNRLQSCLSQMFAVVGYMTDYQCMIMNLSSVHKMSLRLNTAQKDGIICIMKTHQPSHQRSHTGSRCSPLSVFLSNSESKLPKSVRLSAESLSFNFTQQRDYLLEHAGHKPRSADSKMEHSHSVNRDKTIHNKAPSISSPNRKRHKSDGTSLLGKSPLLDMINNKIRKRHRTSSNVSTDTGEKMETNSESEGSIVAKVKDTSKYEKKKEVTHTHSDSHHSKTKSHKDKPSESKPSSSKKYSHHSSKHSKENKKTKELVASPKKSLKVSLMEKLESSLMGGKKKGREKSDGKTKPIEKHKKSSKSSKSSIKAHNQHEAQQVFSSVFTSAGLTKQLGRIPKKAKPGSEVASPAISISIEQSDNSQDISAADKVVNPRVKPILDVGTAIPDVADNDEADTENILLPPERGDDMELFETINKGLDIKSMVADALFDVGDKSLMTGCKTPTIPGLGDFNELELLRKMEVKKWQPRPRTICVTECDLRISFKVDKFSKQASGSSSKADIGDILYIGLFGTTLCQSMQTEYGSIHECVSMLHDISANSLSTSIWNKSVIQDGQQMYKITLSRTVKSVNTSLINITKDIVTNKGMQNLKPESIRSENVREPTRHKLGMELASDSLLTMLPVEQILDYSDDSEDNDMNMYNHRNLTDSGPTVKDMDLHTDKLNHVTDQDERMVRSSQDSVESIEAESDVGLPEVKNITTGTDISPSSNQKIDTIMTETGNSLTSDVTDRNVIAEDGGEDVSIGKKSSLIVLNETVNDIPVIGDNRRIVLKQADSKPSDILRNCSNEENDISGLKEVALATTSDDLKKSRKRTRWDDLTVDSQNISEVTVNPITPSNLIEVPLTATKKSSSNDKLDTKKENLQVEMESNKNTNASSKNQSNDLTENRSRKSISPEEQENTSRKSSSHDEADNKARQSNSHGESECRSRKVSSRDESESRVKKVTLRDESESRSRRSSSRDECENKPTRIVTKSSRDSNEKSERSADVTAFLQKLSTTSEVIIDIDKGKRNERAEKRRNRQYHPYKKGRSGHHTPHWSFDLAYSDMNELLQNLTENTYKCQGHVPVEVPNRSNSRRRSSSGRSNGRQGRFWSYSFIRSTVYRTPPREDSSSEDEFDLKDIPELKTRAKQADLLEEKFSTGKDEGEYSQEMQIYEKDTTKEVSNKKGNLGPPLVIPGGPKTSTYSLIDLTEDNNDADELAFGLRNKTTQDSDKEPQFYSYSLKLIKDTLNNVKSGGRSRNNSGTKSGTTNQSGRSESKSMNTSGTSKEIQSESMSRHSSGSNKEVQKDSRSRNCSPTRKDTQTESRSRHNSPTRKDTQTESRSRHNSPTRKDSQTESRSRHNSPARKDGLTESRSRHSSAANKDVESKSSTKTQTSVKTDKDQKETLPRSETNTQRSGANTPRTGANTPRTGANTPRTGANTPKTVANTPRTIANTQNIEDKYVSKKQDTHVPKTDLKEETTCNSKNKFSEHTDSSETSDDQVKASRTRHRHGEQTCVGSGNGKAKLETSDSKKVSTNILPSDSEECLDWSDEDETLDKDGSQMNEAAFNEMVKSELKNCYVVVDSLEESEIGDMTNKNSIGRDFEINNINSVKNQNTKSTSGFDEFINSDNECMVTIDVCDGDTDAEGGPGKVNDGEIDNAYEQMSSNVQDGNIPTTVVEQKSVTVLHTSVETEHKEDSEKGIVESSDGSESHMDSKQCAVEASEDSNPIDISANAGTDSSLKRKACEEDVADSQDSDDININENLPGKTNTKEVAFESEQCNKADDSSHNKKQHADPYDESESVDDNFQNDMVSEEANSQEETHCSTSLDKPGTVELNENLSDSDSEYGEESRKVACVDSDRSQAETDENENSDVDKVQDYRIDEMVVIEELEHSSISSAENESNEDCDKSCSDESADNDDKASTDTTEENEHVKDHHSSAKSFHTMADKNENVEQPVDGENNDMPETTCRSLDSDCKDENNNADDYANLSMDISLNDKQHVDNLLASEESELSDGFSSVYETADESNMVNKDSSDKLKKYENVKPQIATDSSNDLVAHKLPPKFVSQLDDDSVVVVQDNYIQDNSDTTVPTIVPTSIQNQPDALSKQATDGGETMVNGAHQDSSTCPNLNISSTSAMCDAYGNIQGNNYNHSAWMYNTQTGMPSPYYASPMNQYPWQQYQGNYMNAGQGHLYAEMNPGVWAPNNAFSPYMTHPNYLMAHNTPGLPVEQMPQPMWNPYSGYQSPQSSAFAAAPWIMSPGHMTPYMPGTNPNTFYVTQAAPRFIADSMSPSRKCEKFPNCEGDNKTIKPAKNEHLDIDVSDIPLPSSKPLSNPESLAKLCSKYMKPTGITWRGKASDRQTIQEQGVDGTITDQSESFKRCRNVESLKILSKKCYENAVLGRNKCSAPVKCDARKIGDEIICAEKSDDVQNVTSLKEMCRNMLTKVMEDNSRDPQSKDKFVKNKEDNLKCSTDDDHENSVRDVLNDIILNIENHDSLQIESEEDITAIQSCQVVLECSSVNETEDLMKVTVECTITHQEHAIQLVESDSQRLGDTDRMSDDLSEDHASPESKNIPSPEKQHAGCQNAGENVDTIVETNTMNEELKLFYESIQEVGNGHVKEVNEEDAMISIETVPVKDLDEASAETVKDLGETSAEPVKDLGETNAETVKDLDDTNAETVKDLDDTNAETVNDLEDTSAETVNDLEATSAETVNDVEDTCAEKDQDKTVVDVPESCELPAGLEDDFIPCTPEHYKHTDALDMDSEDAQYDGQKSLTAIATAYLEPDETDNEQMNMNEVKDLLKADCNSSHEDRFTQIDEVDSKRQGDTCRSNKYETIERATQESKYLSNSEQQHAGRENSSHSESSDKAHNMDDELKLFYESIDELGKVPVIEAKQEITNDFIETSSVNGLGNNNVEPIKDIEHAPDIDKLSAGLEDDLIPNAIVNDKCTGDSRGDSADVCPDVQNSLASIAAVYVEGDDSDSEQLDVNESKHAEDISAINIFSASADLKHEEVETEPTTEANDLLKGDVVCDISQQGVLENEQHKDESIDNGEVMKLAYENTKELEEVTEGVARDSIETDSVNREVESNVECIKDVDIEDASEINNLPAVMEDKLIHHDPVDDRKCANDSGIDSEVVHHDCRRSLATLLAAYSEDEDIEIGSETCNESSKIDNPASVVIEDVGTNKEHVYIETSMDRGEKNLFEAPIIDSKPSYMCEADGDHVKSVICSKSLENSAVEEICRTNDDEPPNQPEKNVSIYDKSSEDESVMSSVNVEENKVTGFENMPIEQTDAIDKQMKLFYASIQSEDEDKETCEFSDSSNVSVCSNTNATDIKSMYMKSSLSQENCNVCVADNLLSEETEALTNTEELEKLVDEEHLVVSQESSDTEDDLMCVDFEIDDVECETMPQDTVRETVANISGCYPSSDHANVMSECYMVSTGLSGETSSDLHPNIECKVGKIPTENAHEDAALDNIHGNPEPCKHADSLNFLSMAYAEADNSNLEIPLEVESSVGTEAGPSSLSDEDSLLSGDNFRKAVLKSPKTEVNEMLRCKWTEQEVCAEEIKQEENDTKGVDAIEVDAIANDSEVESGEYDSEEVDATEDIDGNPGEKDDKSPIDRPIYTDAYLKSRGIVRATDARTEMMHPTTDKKVVKSDPDIIEPVNKPSQMSIQLRLQNLSKQNNYKVKESNVCMPEVSKKKKNKGLRKALHYKVLMNASRSNSKKLTVKMEERKSSEKAVEERNKYVSQWLHGNKTSDQEEQSVEPSSESCSASDSADKTSVTSASSATLEARLAAARAKLGVKVPGSDTSKGSLSRGSSLWNAAQRSSSRDSSLSNPPALPVLPLHSAVKQNRQYRRKSQRTSTSPSSSESATCQVGTNYPSVSTRVDDDHFREKVVGFNGSQRSRQYSRCSSTASDRSVSPVYFRKRRSGGIKSPTDASKYDKRYRRSNKRSKSPFESNSDRYPELSDSSEYSRERNRSYHHLSARNKSPPMRSQEIKTRNDRTYSSSSDRRNRSFEEHAEYPEDYRGQCKSSKDRSRSKEVKSAKPRSQKRYVVSPSPSANRSDCSSPTGEASFRSPVRYDRQSRQEGGRKCNTSPVVTDSESGKKWSRSQNKYRKINNTEVKDVRTNETKTENDVKTVQNTLVTKPRRQKKRVLMLTTLLKSMKMSDLVCILQKLIQNSSTCCHWILTLLSSQLATLEPLQCALIEALEHEHSCLHIIHSVDNLDSYVVMELKDTNVVEIYIITEPLAQDENVRSIIKYCCMDTFLNKYLS